MFVIPLISKQCIHSTASFVLLRGLKVTGRMKTVGENDNGLYCIMIIKTQRRCKLDFIRCSVIALKVD